MEQQEDKLEFFSTVFDDQGDAKKNPFKFNKSNEAGDAAFKSYLFRAKKSCPFHTSVIK